MTKRLILLLVVLAIIPIALLLIGLAVWTTATSPSGGVGEQPVSATPAPLVSPSELSTPQPTAAAIPDAINPDRLTLPPDAKLPTVDRAVAFARVWAKEDGAANPRLAEIRLETLKTALETTYRQHGTDPAEAKVGRSDQELQRPVWRIAFSGTYHIPSCPAPVNSATSDNCGTTTGAEYVIDALTGQWYENSYGFNPLPSTTP